MNARLYILIFCFSERGESILPVYAVDSTDPSKYDEHVLTPALAIIEAFTKVRH